MICPKCNKEVDDNLKICPFCESVLIVEEKGPHYDYSKNSMKARQLKNQETVYTSEEYELSKEKRTNAFLLFKDTKFILINLLIISILFGLEIFLYNTTKLEELFPSLAFTSINLFIIVYSIIFEMVLYKMKLDWLKGFIHPLAIIDMQFEIDEKSKLNVYRCVFMIIITTLAYQGYEYFWEYIQVLGLEGGYKILLAILFIVTLVYVIPAYYHFIYELSSRFKLTDANKILFLVLPIIYFPYLAIDTNKEYTRLSDIKI